MGKIRNELVLTDKSSNIIFVILLKSNVHLIEIVNKFIHNGI
jgi:hypothetical protein